MTSEHTPRKVNFEGSGGVPNPPTYRPIELAMFKGKGKQNVLLFTTPGTWSKKNHEAKKLGKSVEAHASLSTFLNHEN